MAKAQDLFQEFLDMEDYIHVYDYEIDGIPFWELVRFPIFNRIFRTWVKSRSGAELSSMDRFKYYLSTAFNIRRNPLFTGQKDVLFVGSARRFMLRDGYWWDIYTDFVAERLGVSSVTTEFSINLEHKIPAKTKNIRYSDFVDLLLAIDDRLRLTHIPVKKEQMKRLETLYLAIKNRFGIRIDIPKLVLEKLRRFKISFIFHRMVLERIRPKICLLVDSYGKEGFIKAAKSLEIPVAELQHGLISHYHAGYSFPGHHRKKTTFPDYLLTFGDYWVNSASFPIDDDHVIPVGYPFLEYQKKRLHHVEKKNQVVIISQPSIGHILSRAISEAKELMNLDWNLVYKLHPLECSNWKTCYPQLIDSDIRVIDDNRTSIHQLFAESKVQIGVYSTALFEGLAFDLDTILFNAPGVGNMNHLIDSGSAVLVRNATEIVSALEGDRPKEFDRKHFFRPNALKNVVQFISAFLD